MTCHRAEPVIAIVDDEAPVRGGLERLVRSSGYDVVSYASGSDFLRSLDVSRPSCVLLDLHMPALSGFDVLKSLRQQPVAIPVIVVSGNLCSKVADQVMALGAAVCLDKPVDAPALFDAISAALNHSSER